jgi:hypothetical protein
LNFNTHLSVFDENWNPFEKKIEHAIVNFMEDLFPLGVSAYQTGGRWLENRNDTIKEKQQDTNDIAEPDHFLSPM